MSLFTSPSKKLFLALALLSLACGWTFASGKVDSGEGEIFKAQKDYDSSKYLTAVGSGSTLEGASSSAKLSLCQILGESIQGQQQISSSANNLGEESASIQLNVNERAIFDHITGISIAESSRGSDGLMYALAVLNKKQAADYYLSKANELNLEASALVKKAEANRGRVEALSYMKSAMKNAEDNAYNVGLLSVLDSARGRVVSLTYQNPAQLATKRSELARDMRVWVKVNGNQADNDLLLRLQSIFASYLSGQGMTVVDQSDSSATHQLETTLSFENAASTDNVHHFIRYSLTSALTEKATGKNLPYSVNGREGHVTEIQAKNRALIKIQEDINQNFPL